MRYFLISFAMHTCLLLLFLVGLDNNIKIAGGSGPAGEGESGFIIEFEKQDIQEQEQTIQEKLFQEKPALESINLEDPNKKQDKKDNLEKQKKEEKKQLNLKEKKEQKKKELALESSKTETKKNTEKQDIKRTSKEGTKNKNYTGNGEGHGNGTNKGKGFGEGKASDDAEIASTIYEIQNKIMHFWFPPEEFAARKDITIEVEIHLDNNGNIISYQLINPKPTDEYRAIAASVLRVLNDPRVVPLPIGKHKRFNNIILKFCPRDLI